MCLSFILATTTSSTFRPSPPWLITSQPSVWRSTVPTSFGSVSGVGGGGGGVTSNTNSAEKPRAPSGVYHLTQPTFRPQITFPPNLRPGVIKVYFNHLCILHLMSLDIKIIAKLYNFSK